MQKRADLHDRIWRTLVVAALATTTLPLAATLATAAEAFAPT